MRAPREFGVFESVSAGYNQFMPESQRRPTGIPERIFGLAVAAIWAVASEDDVLKDAREGLSGGEQCDWNYARGQDLRSMRMAVLRAVGMRFYR